MNLIGLFNRLLPFATPGTPVFQDICHLAAICILLYFAPQIQERLQRQREAGQQDADEAESVPEAPPAEALNGHIDAQQQDQLDEEGELDVDAFANAEQAPAGVNELNGREEGPAGPARPRAIPPERNVGAKKAKALARKDRQRAYNEFMRSQGDAQRARDASGAAEREKTLAVERERRKAAADAFDTQKAKEREARRAKEEAARLEEIKRREAAIKIVKEALESRKACNLWRVAEQIGGDTDDEWVGSVLKTSGMLGKQADYLTMITTTGWVVSVTREDMASLYQEAIQADLGDKAGRIGYDELGNALERIIQR